MTSVLKKSRGTKGKSESMQEDLPARWCVSREHKTEDAAKLIKYIDDSIIGKGTSFCGPFGRRKGKYSSLVFGTRAWYNSNVAQLSMF